ncbi:signal peptidase I T [Clostridium tepidiprofundi DSM 19306]|uniref:Signal peptidase I n=1 Tax=Clostridium tepidiprofundi DSM 19306 TaxID=1121338 RepID=A0A151AT69_9CLOT|nr:signal peptidase I [Clostridium tepidiprofundi]KYH30782.1 signal peptidase I T [Clostridium tepidiprofundi DSM 19306]
MQRKLVLFLKDTVPFLQGIAFALAFYLIVTKFIFFNIIVPTTSMYPTIQPNDRIFTLVVHKPSYLKRGDIVVFYSHERDEKMVKRLIGLPQDKVTINEDGSVYVNDKKLDEPYVKNQLKQGEVYSGLHYGTYTVPKGHYFFLGDNRTNSFDSRYWKNPFIGEKDILSKASAILFPRSRRGTLTAIIDRSH